MGSKSSRSIQPAKSAQAAAPSSVGAGRGRGLTRPLPRRKAKSVITAASRRLAATAGVTKGWGAKADELITDDNGSLLSAMCKKPKLNSTCAYSSENVAAVALCRVLSPQPSRRNRLGTKKQPQIRYQICYHRSRSSLIESGRGSRSMSGSTSSQSGDRSW